MPNHTLHVIVKFFLPVAAGIETNISQTYSVLQRTAFNVVIHTSLNTLTESNVLKPHETIMGLKVNRYPWKWWGFWPNLTTIGSKKKQKNLIALHNSNVFPHTQFMLKSMLDKLMGRKNYVLVVTPHGGFTPQWSIFPAPIRVIKWLYHRTVGAWLMNWSIDGIRAVSRWEKLEMMKYGITPGLITVIDNGIEDIAFTYTEKDVSAKFKKTIKSFGRYLIQIGRIHEIKNYETVIKALPYIDDDVRFVIAGPIGDHSYKKSLEDLISSLGLEKRVIFLGVVKGADKFYLMKKAQMMVHMAIWESYCNVVHEGMSQGLVCLVANNTALPLLIQDGVNGFCLPTLDHKTLSEKIAWVLKHKGTDLVTKIEKRNRQIVKSHSWRHVAERMGAWYSHLLGS